MVPILLIKLFINMCIKIYYTLTQLIINCGFFRINYLKNIIILYYYNYNNYVIVLKINYI